MEVVERRNLKKKKCSIDISVLGKKPNVTSQDEEKHFPFQL